MKKFLLILFATLSAFSVKAQDPYLGEIRMVGFNYVPQGWAACNGQMMQIMQNQALFALLGTTYGGDGRYTFALPDLRGRLAVNPSQGVPGLIDIQQGQKGGASYATLLPSNLPLGVGTPVGVSRNDTTGVKVWPAGPAGGVPVSTQPPYLGVYFIIATQGLFPPRQ